MIAFSALLIFILLLLTFFFLFKMPSAIKGCNLVSSPLYMAVQVIAIVLFLTSLILGDGNAQLI